MSTGPILGESGVVRPLNAAPSTKLQEPIVSFHDGDMVFVAQDVRFCVHEDILSQQSPGLARIITGASPVSYTYISQPSGQAKVEARVTDTAYDFNELLRYIYRSRHSVPQGGGYDEDDLDDADSATPFPVLAAWLRLGCKYHFERLADAARKQLQRLFPQSLSDWDNRAAIRTRHAFEPQHAVEGFKLFRHVNEARAIPIALYMLCQLDDAAVLMGVPRADGSGQMVRLSVQDRVLVYEARRELARHGAKLVEACAMFERSEVCDGGEVCYAVMYELQHGARDEKKALLAGDPLDSALLDYIRGLEDPSCWSEGGGYAECDSDGACAACIRETVDFWVELREIVWRELPRIAGVEKVYYY